MALNLEKQLRFYGAYHYDPVNVGIHMVCVPMILWTTFTLFTNSGPLIPLPAHLTPPHLDLNAGTLFCLSYCALYILLEPVAGTAYSVLLLASTAYGHYLVKTYGMTANYLALAGFVVSWIAQFVGHGVFEGRAPALLDNLFQAFFLAPLFVWLEGLFALGYRPELKNRIDKLILQDVMKFREEREAKQKLNGKVNGNGNGSVAVGVNGHAKQS